MNLYFDVQTIPLENTEKLFNKEILEHYKEYKDFKEEFNMIYCISVWVNTKEKWFYTKTFFLCDNNYLNNTIKTFLINLIIYLNDYNLYMIY